MELNARHSQFLSECQLCQLTFTASKWNCPRIQMHVTATHFPLSSLRSLCDPFLLPDGQPARFGEFLFLSRVSSQPPAIIFTLPISLSDRLTQIFVFVTFRLAGGLPPTARSRAGECRSTTTLPATRTVSGRQGLRWPAYVDYIWWWCYVRYVDWMI